MTRQFKIEMLSRQAEELEQDSRDFRDVGLRWLSVVTNRSAQRTRKEIARLSAPLR